MDRIKELKELIEKFNHNPFKKALYQQELAKLQSQTPSTTQTTVVSPVESISIAKPPKAEKPKQTESQAGKRGRKSAISGKDINQDSQAQNIISDSSLSNGKKNAELTKMGYSVSDIANATNQRADVVRMDVYRAKKKGLI